MAKLLRENWLQLSQLVLAALGVCFLVLQIKSDRDSAESASKAYLGVNWVAPAVQDDGAILATLALENGGQTPAHDIQVVLQHDLKNLPINMPKDFPKHLECDAVRELKASPVYMPASDSRGFARMISISNEDRVALVDPAYFPNDGPQHTTLYVFGTACYRDVFGDEREYKFCMSFHGPELGRLRNCPAGDKAT